MNLFSQKRVPSPLAPGVIATILAAIAVILSDWNAMLPSRFPNLAAIHLTLKSAIFAAAFAVLWQFCETLFGVNGYLNESWLVSGVRIAACSSTMTGILAIYLWPLQVKSNLAVVLATFLVCAVVCEVVRLLITSHLHRQKSSALIVGSGRLATKAWRQFRIQPGSDVTLVGFVDQASETEMCPDIAARYLGNLEDLSRIILQNNIDDVIVATLLSRNSVDAKHALYLAGAIGSRIVCLKDVCGIRQDAVLARDDDDAFFELVTAVRLQGPRQAAKRGFDVVVSSAVLLVGSPLLLLAAILAASHGRGLSFEPEKLLGFRRKLFTTYRIESVPGNLLLQLWVKTLPRMWSVLRGEMSLVGPPPLSMRDISNVDPSSLIGRFNVRPGIAGCLDFEQLSKQGPATSDMTINQIDYWSLRTDLRILARTFRAVIGGIGAVETGAGIL